MHDKVKSLEDRMTAIEGHKSIFSGGIGVAAWIVAVGIALLGVFWK
jgi:hypothetical protein